MKRTNGKTFLAAAGLGAMLAAMAALAAGCTPQESGSGNATDAGSRETPSAMDHTYHGELMKARERAIRTLDGVGAQRRQLEQEERSFDRPASPTPRENP